MENNQMNNPFLHKRQDKDTHFKDQTEVNFIPEFDNLNNAETLIEHIEELKEKHKQEKENKGLFKVKSANKWIEESKLKPIPKILFSEFWFEGELCILFADTNQGKSILAVQIGDSISKGKPIPGFKLEAEKQPVLYFDFELSAKQFEARYSIKNHAEKKFENHYDFDNGFIRIEINPLADIPEGMTFEEYLNNSIEQSITETGAKVLIIDNLTYLKSELEKSKEAAPLVKHLQLIIDKYECSILILAHTPKRDLSKPISRNDLQGSKRLIDFCDSAFAIGESHVDKQVKYLKQIKVRAMEFLYDRENVIVGQLNKAYNFLQFEFLNFCTEQEHLKRPTEKDKENTIAEVKTLSQRGMSQRQISKELGIGLGTVNKYLKM